MRRGNHTGGEERVVAFCSVLEVSLCPGWIWDSMGKAVARGIMEVGIFWIKYDVLFWKRSSNGAWIVQELPRR